MRLTCHKPCICTRVANGQPHELDDYLNFMQQQYALEVKWSNIDIKRSPRVNAILKL